MKKFKRIITLLLIAVMGAVLLTSCGKTKATPEESAKYFIDMVLKNDKSNMDKIGFTEEDYSKLRTALEENLISGFTNSGVSSNILTEDIKKGLKDNILAGFSKVEYEVGVNSTEKKVAKVEIKIKGFDVNKIAEQATVKVQDVYTEAMTQEQIFQEQYKFIGEGFANGILVEQPTTLTLTLNKVGSYWMTDENSSRGLMESLVASQ